MWHPLVVHGAMHSGKMLRSVLWSNAMHSCNVRRISSFGYLMTSLKIASGLDKQESIFTPSLWPWRFSPLNLSHETKRDGKVTAQEHVERNKYGLFRFRATKSSLKVQSTVVFGIPLMWNCLWLQKNFRSVMNFLLWIKLPSETRINLPVVYAKRFHMHDSLVHMHGL